MSDVRGIYKYARVILEVGQGLTTHSIQVYMEGRVGDSCRTSHNTHARERTRHRSGNLRSQVASGLPAVDGVDPSPDKQVPDMSRRLLVGEPSAPLDSE